MVVTTGAVKIIILFWLVKKKKMASQGAQLSLGFSCVLFACMTYTALRTEKFCLEIWDVCFKTWEIPVMARCEFFSGECVCHGFCRSARVWQSLDVEIDVGPGVRGSRHDEAPKNKSVFRECGRRGCGREHSARTVYGALMQILSPAHLPATRLLADFPAFRVNFGPFVSLVVAQFLTPQAGFVG